MARNLTKNTRLFLLTVIAALLLLFIALILAISYIFTQTAPVDATASQPISFSVGNGESVASISQRLKSSGIIKNSNIFKIVIRLEGVGRQIQAGKFQLTRSMSAQQIAQALTNGQADFVKVTLIEGWRREEMADELEKILVSNQLDFDKTQFLNLTTNLEGFLFPDTYFIPDETSTQQIIALLEDNFKTQTQKIENIIQQDNRSLQDIITLASIIEREARQDRKIVSGILWKRLDNNWPLQVDASLQYIKGYDSKQKTWWPTPLAIDKQLNSPFNTYQFTGLPPAPIANPSLDSIKAAAQPIETNYWYYITGNDGQMYYATTIQEHNQNISNHLR